MVFPQEKEGWADYAYERYLRIPICAQKLEGQACASAHAFTHTYFHNGRIGTGPPTDT